MKDEFVSPAHLARHLEGREVATTLLLLDCRPQAAFNQGHIRSAVNTFCPSILRRRGSAKGYVRLETVLAPDMKWRVRAGEFSSVILYDDGSMARETSDLTLILHGLHKHAYGLQSVTVLRGGYPTFRSKFPELCDRSVRTVKPVPVAQCGQPSPIQLSRPAIDTQLMPSELLSHLYIGEEKHILHPDILHRIGITAILNVSTSCLDQPPSGFRYKSIPIRDNSTENISTWFNETLQYIEDTRREGGKVLVHCKAGVSRSATICIAYLMVHSSLSLDKAFDFVQARRTIIAPNMNFMQQLWEFERVLLMTSMRSSALTSSHHVTSLSCAYMSEMSPSLKRSASFEFNEECAFTQ
ncbi:dual specificity protein phosphatase 4-like [Mya arenaria]|uniref:dual specificity protein phosphatase 4-like n=1 Tax=Mya arenaria TaxID=6604 RepID=UPI0022E90E5B|nr:dual specificity protein phosphatase 4-like [Mya arenaria]